MKQSEFINCTTSFHNVEKKKARGRALKLYFRENNPISYYKVEKKKARGRALKLTGCLIPLIASSW